MRRSKYLRIFALHSGNYTLITTSKAPLHKA